MSTIFRLRERHSHAATTARKIGEVAAIAREYQTLRRDITQRYWRSEHLPVVMHNPMSVVTLRRKNGEAKANPLGSHLQAQAVLDGLDVVRGSWNQALTAVRSAAAWHYHDTTETVIDPLTGKSVERKVENPARHEINWLLCWPEHLVAILDDETVIPTDRDGTPAAKFAANDHARLDCWLAQALRKHRPGQPSLKHKVAFEIDAYRVAVRKGKFPVWLSIAGLTKGKPLRIPMAGTDTEFLDGTANLRVALVTDAKGVKRLVFRKAVKIEVTERTGAEVVGIDKGANIAIAATSSDTEHAQFFGADAGAILTRRSERSFRRGRSRLVSQADNLAGHFTPSGRFHGNPNPTAAQKRTARHIRKNNLGTQRRDAEQCRGKAELKNVAGRSAREMMEAFPDAGTFYEEKLNFRGTNQKRPAKTKRKLNRWTKKELSDAIDRHVSASGARREFVAAAYTSQACPRCSWTNQENRKDQVFVCEHCSYTGHADAVASSNVLARGSDQTITLFTPVKEVKQILLARHAKWRASAGPDARCASWGCGLDLPAVGPAGPSDTVTASSTSANGWHDISVKPSSTFWDITDDAERLEVSEMEADALEIEELIRFDRAEGVYRPLVEWLIIEEKVYQLSGRTVVAEAAELHTDL